MLKVANLNVSIGPIPIIRDASLSVNEGALSAATGPEKPRCSAR